VLQPDPVAPRVTELRELAECKWDALIAGPFLSLIDLARGKLDGDALLFSREIRIESDMEAMLALRNALDAEGVDLLAEGADPLSTIDALRRNPLHSGRQRRAARGRRRGPS
jgi:O2-independent ubiquinone biosynthesis accessory factor UbiT